MVKRKGMPQQGELIVCTVEKITPNAAWCRLDEYPKLEGMIHVTESAGRWVYNIKDAVKLKKQYVAKVMRIDHDTKDVNLSLKRVSRFDSKRKMNQFGKEKRAENILNNVAKSMKKSLDEAYEEVGFLLQENFGELSIAFGEIKDDVKVLEKIVIKKEWKDTLIDVINRMLVEKKILLKAKLDIKSYSEDGINIIKNSLANLEKKGFTVKYISAPNYTVEIITQDPKKMERTMRNYLEELVGQMKSNNAEASYEIVK